MKGVSESLTGRIGILDLLGLSLRELEQVAAVNTPFLPTSEQLEKRISRMVQYSLKDIYHLFLAKF